MVNDFLGGTVRSVDGFESTGCIQESLQCFLFVQSRIYIGAEIIPIHIVARIVALRLGINLPLSALVQITYIYEISDIAAFSV